MYCTKSNSLFCVFHSLIEINRDLKYLCCVCDDGNGGGGGFQLGRSLVVIICV